MKEYKVISWNVGLINNNQRLEDLLNEHAVNGWRVVHIAENTTRIVLEKDKNR